MCAVTHAEFLSLPVLLLGISRKVVPRLCECCGNHSRCSTVSFAAKPAEGADTLVFYGTDGFWPFFPIVFANACILIYVVIIYENVG